MDVTPEQEAQLRELLFDGHPDGVHWMGDEPTNDIAEVVLRWVGTL